MRRHLVLTRLLVFSACIIASVILLMIPREQHVPSSDIILVTTKIQYGFPLAWRTKTSVITRYKNSSPNSTPVSAPSAETAMDSQKLIINILIFGSVTTLLLFATSALEKHQ